MLGASWESSIFPAVQFLNTSFRNLFIKTLITQKHFPQIVYE